MSIEALRARNIELFGVVMVGDKNPSNKKAIEHYGACKVILELEMMDKFDKNAFKLAFDKIDQIPG